MPRLILALAALTALSACSDLRDRREPAADNTARALRMAPLDTAGTSKGLASRNDQAVSPVEQQVTRPEPANPAPRAAAHRKRPSAPPKQPTDTASARGYAPAPAPDSTAARDTAVASRKNPVEPTDTVVATRTDTASKAVDTTSSVASVTSAAPAAGASANLSAAERTLPIGTTIHAALDDSINSRRDSAGRTITAQIMENVTSSNGRTLIPAGTPVHLTVTRLSAAKSKSAQGRLGFRVDGIEMGGGLEAVQANVQPVPHELRGRGVTGSEAAKVGVGAAGGAVLGRVLGGNTKGAVIGGVLGAAGGAAVASQTATRDVVVKAKTPVVIVLTAPLVAQ